MVVRNCLEMIEPVFLTPEILLALFTNPMLLGVCPMALGSFNRYEVPVASTTPYMAIRVDPVAL